MDTQLSRLYYLACELSPALPESALLTNLGECAKIIRAGATYGMMGASEALPGTSVDILQNLYVNGIITGASPNEQEFRSLLAGRIHEKLCANEHLSNIDKIKSAGKLDRWLQKEFSNNANASIDWDAEIITPPFTLTGWWPIDRIHGEEGTAQEITTLLSRPGVGKTTIALAMAMNWRRNNIGSVIMLQSELAPAMVLNKVKKMGTEGLFRSGVDRMVFGNRYIDEELDRCIQEPDPDRLVLFDSLTGYCGQGDTPASRERFAHLYTVLCQVKNASRMAVCFSHVKRGTDIADIEVAAGSSSVERFSGYLDYISSDGSHGPDGRVVMKLQSLKNRWDGVASPFTFNFDYVTGEAQHTINDGEDF